MKIHNNPPQSKPTQHEKKKTKKHKCQWCGKQYYTRPGHNNTKYCTKKCRKEGTLEKTRERVRKHRKQYPPRHIGTSRITETMNPQPKEEQKIIKNEKRRLKI